MLRHLRPYTDGEAFWFKPATVDISLQSFVKKIAEKETHSILSDLGELVAEKNLRNYTINDQTVEFNIRTTSHDYMALHAKKTNDVDWTFITRFGGK
jgi:hypothetical protein